MNHNPQNLKIGELVQLDSEYNNSSVVRIIDFTPNQMFATVKSAEGATWDVMTNRLTKQNVEKKK